MIAIMGILQVFEKIAERRIQEAMERGEFENLEGKGKPLVLEDLSHVPEELRMAYKILKNAGYLPPEVQLMKEIKTTEDLLDHLEDEGTKYRQIKKLNLLITKLNLMRRRPVNLEKEQVYYEKIVAKVRVRRRS